MIHAACTALPARVAPIPSMVVTFLPVAADTGVEQERTGCPSICTVHAPHCAMPQPNLVPVRWSESRSTHSRGVPGAASTSRVLPLTTRETMKTPSGMTVRLPLKSYSGGPRKSTGPFATCVLRRPRAANRGLRSGTLCQEAQLWGRMRSRRARPGLRHSGERCGIHITTPSRPRRRQPTASGGLPNEIPALRFAPHRRAERAHRAARVLARARHGAGERRQRHVPLRFLDCLQRLARAAVVSVRRGLPALLRIHAAAQRAYPDRRDRRQPVAPRPDVDRHLRHAFLPAADGDLCHVALLADIHERLEQQRDLRQRRRADPVAGAASCSRGLLPALAAGRLGADQTHRLSQGSDPRSPGEARGAPRARHRARRSRQMTQLLIAYMAPLMFAALVVFLLLGYPVSFALAAIGLSFGFLGIELGLLTPALFGALPERIFGIMSNDTLLAVPFFTFMGLILERSGMAEDLLNTIGQLFGPIRGGLAYAVIFVGALLAATTGAWRAASSPPPGRWRRSFRRRSSSSCSRTSSGDRWATCTPGRSFPASFSPRCTRSMSSGSR